MTVVKKLIAICLLGAFLLANIGCGGGDTKKTEVKSTAGSSSTEVKKDTKDTK